MNGLYMENGFNIGVVNDQIHGTIFCKLYHMGIYVTIMEHIIIDSKLVVVMYN